MIASMIKWDHSTEWTVANFCDKGSRSGELVVDVDLSKEDDQYLSGHAIDGRVLFPATGYLVNFLKTFFYVLLQTYDFLDVSMEDVRKTTK